MFVEEVGHGRPAPAGSSLRDARQDVRNPQVPDREVPGSVPVGHAKCHRLEIGGKCRVDAPAGPVFVVADRVTHASVTTRCLQTLAAPRGPKPVDPASRCSSGCIPRRWSQPGTRQATSDRPDPGNLHGPHPRC